MPHPTTTRSLVGVGPMLAATAIFPFIDLIAKLLSREGMPILIVVWARALFGGLMTLPFTLKAEGTGNFLPARPLHHLAWAVLFFNTTFLFFEALKHLQIADALAILFVNPLVIVVLSALVLDEKVGPRRWIAVAVGFLGKMIIVRPGMVEMNAGTLYALGAGVALESYFVMTRHIAGAADAMVLTFPTTAIGALLMTMALPFLWQTPSP